MQQSDDRSLKELLGDLTNSVTTLFRKEIELARTEIGEKFSDAGVAVGSLAAGNPRARCAPCAVAGLGPRLTELGLAPGWASLIVGGSWRSSPLP
jgi:hypothetical protein